MGYLLYIPRYGNSTYGIKFTPFQHNREWPSSTSYLHLISVRTLISIKQLHQTKVSTSEDSNLSCQSCLSRILLSRSSLSYFVYLAYCCPPSTVSHVSLAWWRGELLRMTNLPAAWSGRAGKPSRPPYSPSCGRFIRPLTPDRGLRGLSFPRAKPHQQICGGLLGLEGRIPQINTPHDTYRQS